MEAARLHACVDAGLSLEKVHVYSSTTLPVATVLSSPHVYFRNILERSIDLFTNGVVNIYKTVIHINPQSYGLSRGGLCAFARLMAVRLADVVRERGDVEM